VPSESAYVLVIHVGPRSYQYIQFNLTCAVSVSILHSIEVLAVYIEIDQAQGIDENFDPAVT